MDLFEVLDAVLVK